jgi:hypothetical protein
MNNPFRLPVTTETELRQKIELQNKKISLQNKEISLQNKEISLLLQSMRQEREETKQELSCLLSSIRQKKEERRQKSEQREQMLSLSVSQMEESIAKAKNSNIFNPRDTTNLK